MNMTRIKKLRTQLHLSQEYVANYLGLSRSTYTQMENGKRKVLADEAAKLSVLFGVSADSLLNNTNGMAIEALQAKPKHGKWEIVKLNNYNAVACSECGEPSVAETPYCSYCGAKMDKE